MPEFVKKLSDRHEAFLKLEKEKEKALEALRFAELEKRNAASRFTRLKDKQWSFLTRTASPEIDTAIQFFRDELERLRKPGKIQTVKVEESNNLVDLTKRIKWQTNKPWMLKRLKFCQEAIKQLEEYKMVPKFDVEAVERLKNGLPDESWELVESERTMSKPNPTDYELAEGLAAIVEHKVEQLLYPHRFKKFERTTQELLNM